MPRSYGRDAGLEQRWREALAAWRRSGLSVRAFCRSRRLSEASFYVWRRTLKERDREQAAARTASTTFVPVRVVADALVEIVLPTGLVVRVPATIEAARIATLVAALRTATC